MDRTAFFSNNLDNDRYWRGFRRGDWCHSIAVRDFIVRNVSPYEGDETFLVGPSKRTLGGLGEAPALFPGRTKERRARC